MYITKKIHWDWHLKIFFTLLELHNTCQDLLTVLILLHGINVDAVEILQQSDDISNHYLVSCKL